MKAEELRTKTKDELDKTLVDLKKQQFNLRFQKSQGQLGETAKIRQVRRDIARVKTFLNEKTKAASGEGAKAAKPKAAKKAPAKKASAA
jgi:large subunit ribosomal protein L29